MRHTFTLTNPAAIKSLTVQLAADDGAVVFLNGRELTRRNLPPGPVAHFTAALVNVETNENRFVQLGVSPLNLRSNANTIAVELHQQPEGIDASFDLELIANIPVQRPAIILTRPTNGEHSDDDYFQIEMREGVLPILEAYGVDVVLSGHSHVYERSFLLNGHYGYS